jgi:hypothetical protein
MKPKDGIDLGKDSPYPDQSAKHASYAVEALVRVASSSDSREKDREAEVAKAWATLSLRDKLDEMVAVVRICTERIIDSQTTLDDHVQTAAQHLHKDAQDLKQRLRVIQGEAA